MSTSLHPSTLTDLPATRHLVYQSVAHHEPVTATTIEDVTPVSRPTVYRALDDLKAADLVWVETDAADPRRTLYHTTEGG